MGLHLLQTRSLVEGMLNLSHSTNSTQKQGVWQQREECPHRNWGTPGRAKWSRATFPLPNKLSGFEASCEKLLSQLPLPLMGRLRGQNDSFIPIPKGSAINQGWLEQSWSLDDLLTLIYKFLDD